MTSSSTSSGGDAGEAIEAIKTLISVHRTGTVTSWNPAAEVVLGHRASEAIGEALALIIPLAARARHIAGFRQAVDSGVLTHNGRPTL